MTESSPVTPRTEAGRKLWAKMESHVEAYDIEWLLAVEREASAEGWNRYASSLRAIEREAAAPVTEALRAEIRGMLADLLVTLDAPNPRLALQTGIEAIDYRLAHFEYIAARTPTDSPEESA